MVSLDSEVDPVGDERGGIAEEMDVLVDLLDHLERQLRDESAVGNEEDRDLLVAMANGAENLERSTFIKLALRLRGPSPAGLRSATDRR